MNKIIQRAIHRLLDCKEALTLKTLKTYLENNNDIQISKNKLWKCVRGAEFTFRKYTCGRSVICEKPHLVTIRSKYLTN